MSSGRAVVIGLGRSGLALARVLDAEGSAVRVVDRADDERVRARAAELPPSVEVVLGGYDDAVVDDASLVCPSPAVPWDASILERARRRGIPIRTEIGLVFERCSAPIVGITGTNGKTTTTELVGSVLRAAGLTVHVGGNLGVTMLDRLPGVRPDDWVVLELSSFQLETVTTPRCRIAALLNLAPDHLDRHHTMEAYVAAKRRLVEAADPAGAVVLNADDTLVRRMASAAAAPVAWFGTGVEPGATVRDHTIVWVDDNGFTPILEVSEVPLFGAHNVANVLAAVAVGRCAGVAPRDIAAAVRRFRAVAHRLQPVLEHRGVLWVNDSKATNAEAAIVALRAFPHRPMVWIGGGGSKGVPPDALALEVAARARHAVLNGATAAELAAALARLGYHAVTVVDTLRDAVLAARRLAQPGDVVLLAPGYTSFDQFHSFEERGEAFVRWVHEMVGEPAAAAPAGEREV